jgi:hypothetical protein
MTERDLSTHPYSADERRVAEFLCELGVGGGDDPIGFLMASHRLLADERSRCREALRTVDRDARDHIRSDQIAPALLRPHALRAVRAVLQGEQETGEGTDEGRGSR